MNTAANAAIEQLNRYAFKRDQVGNYIIPKSVLGGDTAVRVQITPRKRIVLDLAGAIMAITIKNSNDAGEVWRNYSEETRSSSSRIFMKMKVSFVIKYMNSLPNDDQDFFPDHH